jgi:hypothetical protein
MLRDRAAAMDSTLDMKFQLRLRESLTERGPERSAARNGWMRPATHSSLQFCFWLTSTCLHRYKFGNGIAGCTARARPPRGIFIHPVAPCIFSTGTIAREGQGHYPEARAASCSPGFKPGQVVAWPLSPPKYLTDNSTVTFGRLGGSP